MALVWRRILTGAAAGAAATTALNAVTFLDMAVRGRPPSRTPEDTVEALAARGHLSIPGDAATRSQRVQGIAALLGLVTGAGIGSTLGFVDASFNGAISRLPVVASGAVFTVAALLAANGPMTGLGVTDPRQWRPSDWASDVVPHVAYGFVAALTYRSLNS
jgi:hypothetical protein